MKFAQLFKMFAHPRSKPGWQILAGTGIACIVLAMFSPVLGLISLFGFIYLNLILRQPSRSLEQKLKRKKGVVYAPVDGRIIDMSYDSETGKLWLLMMPGWIDSHINYAPLDGLVDQHIWYDGTFSRDDEQGVMISTNARQEFSFVSSTGALAIFEQYGSPLARFMLSFTQDGSKVNPDTPIGVSLFRGRLGLSFICDGRPLVQKWQRCLAGETIIGRIRSEPKPDK